MAVETSTYVKAADLDQLTSKGRLVVHVNGHTVVLFAQENEAFALDNRCPHMGFPLHRGSVQDGILTCDWHHARFDLATGGTFDPWADDVISYPVAIRDGEVWVDLATRPDEVARQRGRLREGLERSIPLVAAKACISLLDHGEDPVEPFRIGLGFGLRHRRGGWGQGLTIHACMMNLVPRLYPEDRPLGLFHGLSAVAADTFDMPARFTLRPLPRPASDIATLKRWFRRFVEVLVCV